MPRTRDVEPNDGDPPPDEPELSKPRGKQPAGRLSIRLPRSLHERIARLAEVEGVSLNLFIATALASFVGDSAEKLPGDFPSADEELRAIIGSSEDSVRAAVHTIYSIEDRQGTNLGLVVRALLADRILAVQGAHDASRHLGKSARVAATAGHTALAEAFWEASVTVEPDNRVSAGAFGHFLFDQRRYADAIPYLERSSLTWSSAELALSQLLTSDPASREKAAADVIEALTKNTDGMRALADRRAWLRYARMLYQSDCVSQQDIEKLVDHAGKWAEWQKIETSEVLDLGSA